MLKVSVKDPDVKNVTPSVGNIVLPLMTEASIRAPRTNVLTKRT